MSVLNPAYVRSRSEMFLRGSYVYKMYFNAIVYLYFKFENVI